MKDKEFYDGLVEKAKEMCMARGDHAPMGFIRMPDKDGKHQVALVPLSRMNKESWQGFFRQVTEELNSELYYLINTNWILEVNGEEEKRKADAYYKKHGTIENHPSRREILIISQFDKQEGTFERAFIMKRNNKGDLISLVEHKNLKDFGQIYSKFNCWHQFTFNIKESDVKK